MLVCSVRQLWLADWLFSDSSSPFLAACVVVECVPKSEKENLLFLIFPRSGASAVSTSLPKTAFDQCSKHISAGLEHFKVEGRL